MKPRFRTYLIPILVWLFFSALFVRNYRLDREYERRLVLSAVKEEARLVGRRFETFFRERTADLTSILRSLLDQGGGLASFRALSSQVLRNHPTYEAICWIDAELKLRSVTPGTSHELLAKRWLSGRTPLRQAMAVVDSLGETYLSGVWEHQGVGQVVALVVPIGGRSGPAGQPGGGYVVGILRLDPILQAAFASEERRSFIFSLSDGGKQFLQSAGGPFPQLRQPYTVVLPVLLSHRSWELQVAPSAAYLKASTSATKHIVALATGVLASTVLSFVLGLFLHRRDQLVAALREKRETEVLHSKVVNNTFEGIGISCDQIVRYVNPAFLEMFGYEHAGEVIGKSILTFIAPEEHARIRQLYKRHAAGTPPAPAQFAFVGQRKDGSRFHVELIVSAVELQGKRQTLGFFRDISERMQAEERLRLYKRLFTNVGEGIVIANCEGVIQEVNPAFVRMTGYPESECVGQSLSLFRLDSAASVPLSEILRRVADGGYAGEANYRRRDGTQFPVLNRFDAIRDDRGALTHILVLCMDLTERKSLEAQLLQAQKMESIGTLAGGIAHDFNNLLTGILGYSSFLLTSLPADAPGRAEIQAIEKTALRAADLTKRLLAFSRKAPVHFQALNLNELVRDTVHFLRRSIPKEIEVEVHCDPHLATVQADIGQMQQVLLNLCVNARDAMPDGGKLVIETLNVDLRVNSVHPSARGRTGRFVVLSVTDTGVGIPREEADRIFEPFYTTKEVGKGTGLGLAMVYGIVESHRGWVEVFSEVGVGTTFKVFLPAIKAKGGSAESAQPSVERGDETILVVDDEPVVLQLATSLLEWHGYTVLTASDGEGALRVLSEKSAQIDLVILDLVMPRMSGHETFDRIRRLYPNLKVLLSSGWATENNDIDDLCRRGAVGFVQKPYQAYQLGSAVRQALRFGTNVASSS